MATAKFTQPDYTTQSDSSQYPLNIDAAIQVLAREGTLYAPHEEDTPAMTVRIDAGITWDGTTLTEVAAQSTGTIMAPSVNPRIDRVVIDPDTGAASVVTGAESASPSAPSVTAGKVPCCQVLLQTSSTVITNSMITDERVLAPFGLGTAVRSDKTSVLTKGHTTTSYPIGNSGSGTVTPLISNGTIQHMTITGSFTLAAPTDTDEGYIEIEATNDGTGGYSPDLSTNFANVSGTYDSTAGVINLLQISKHYTNTYLRIAQEA